MEKILKFVFSKVPSFYFGWKPPFARKTYMQKRLRKSWCLSARSAVCFCSQCCSCHWPLWPPLWLRFYIYTLLMYTNTRLIEAE